MRHFFFKRGWQCFLGVSVGFQGGCTWNPPPPRVGSRSSCARASLRRWRRCKRELDPLVWGVWHSTRSVHVYVALGDGANMLHDVSV